MSREIVNGSKNYADEYLEKTEKVLTDTLSKLEKNVGEALKIMGLEIEDYIKTIKANRKELK